MEDDLPSSPTNQPVVVSTTTPAAVEDKPPSLELELSSSDTESEDNGEARDNKEDEDEVIPGTPPPPKDPEDAMETQPPPSPTPEPVSQWKADDDDTSMVDDDGVHKPLARSKPKPKKISDDDMSDDASANPQPAASATTAAPEDKEDEVDKALKKSDKADAKTRFVEATLHDHFLEWMDPKCMPALVAAYLDPEEWKDPLDSDSDDEDESEEDEDENEIEAKEDVVDGEIDTEKNKPLKGHSIENVDRKLKRVPYLRAAEGRTFHVLDARRIEDITNGHTKKCEDPLHLNTAEWQPLQSHLEFFVTTFSVRFGFHKSILMLIDQYSAAWSDDFCPWNACQMCVDHPIIDFFDKMEDRSNNNAMVIHRNERYSVCRAMTHTYEGAWIQTISEWIDVTKYNARVILEYAGSLQRNSMAETSIKAAKLFSTNDPYKIDLVPEEEGAPVKSQWNSFIMLSRQAYEPEYEAKQSALAKAKAAVEEKEKQRKLAEAKREEERAAKAKVKAKTAKAEAKQKWIAKGKADAKKEIEKAAKAKEDAEKKAAEKKRQAEEKEAKAKADAEKKAIVAAEKAAAKAAEKQRKAEEKAAAKAEAKRIRDEAKKIKDEAKAAADALLAKVAPKKAAKKANKTAAPGDVIAPKTAVVVTTISDDDDDAAGDKNADVVMNDHSDKKHTTATVTDSGNGSGSENGSGGGGGDATVAATKSTATSDVETVQFTPYPSDVKQREYIEFTTNSTRGLYCGGCNLTMNIGEKKSVRDDHFSGIDCRACVEAKPPRPTNFLCFHQVPLANKSRYCPVCDEKLREKFHLTENSTGWFQFKMARNQRNATIEAAAAAKRAAPTKKSVTFANPITVAASTSASASTASAFVSTTATAAASASQVKEAVLGIDQWTVRDGADDAAAKPSVGSKRKRAVVPAPVTPVVVVATNAPVATVAATATAPPPPAPIEEDTGLASPRPPKRVKKFTPPHLLQDELKIVYTALETAQDAMEDHAVMKDAKTNMDRLHLTRDSLEAHLENMEKLHAQRLKQLAELNSAMKVTRTLISANVKQAKTYM